MGGRTSSRLISGSRCRRRGGRGGLAFPQQRQRQQQLQRLLLLLLVVAVTVALAVAALPVSSSEATVAASSVADGAAAAAEEEDEDPCALHGAVPVAWREAQARADLLVFLPAGHGQLASHLYPSVGNGYWGTTVFNDTMYIGGVYNGRGAGWNNDGIDNNNNNNDNDNDNDDDNNNNRQHPPFPVPSHRARIPSTLAFRVTALMTGAGAGGGYRASAAGGGTGAGVRVTAEALDLRRAVFLRRVASEDGRVCLEQRLYAHQVHRNLLVQEIAALKVDLGGSGATAALDLVNGSTSADIDFADVPVPPLPAASAALLGGSARAQYGEIMVTEEPTSARVGVALLSTEPAPLVFTKVGDAFSFVSVAVTTLELSPHHPADNSSAAVGAAARAFADFAAMNAHSLRSSHEAAWAERWQAGITISAPAVLVERGRGGRGGQGSRAQQQKQQNITVAIAVNASQYYILSAVREDWKYGISPGGIATNAYNGHVFWDSETWMVPTLIMLHPELARSLLDYRVARLPAAKRKAEGYNAGYRGVMFPWESAFSGSEVCPWKEGALFEQHITADVSFACMRYFYASGDTEWMRGEGAAVVNASAQFWASRVVPVPGEAGKLQILEVIPPDESAGVRNNSCYTNAAAATALRDASWLGNTLGYAVPSDWDAIASSIVIPFNSSLQIHPEYDGYNGELINQPDVVLLQYPLRWQPYSRKVQLNDLTYYTKHTNMASFFTGYSTNGILFLQHGLPEEAQTVFGRAWKFMQSPFSVWREKLSGGHQNFLTGAGGFLQQVVFGYTGMRIDKDALLFSPQFLPRGVQEMVLRRLSYRGTLLHVRFGEQSVSVEQATVGGVGAALVVVQDGKSVPVGTTPVHLRVAPFSLQPASSRRL